MEKAAEMIELDIPAAPTLARNGHGAGSGQVIHSPTPTKNPASVPDNWGREIFSVGGLVRDRAPPGKIP